MNLFRKLVVFFALALAGQAHAQSGPAGANQVWAGPASGSGFAQWRSFALRTPNPLNLFVATAGNGGSDSNTCVSGSPCLTLRRACNLAAAFDLQSTSVVINVGAGTFGDGCFVIGSQIANVSGTSGLALGIQIVGAGSANTFVTLTSSCSPNSVVSAQKGAVIGVGSMTISSTCAGGSDIDIEYGGTVYLIDNDVNFGTAAFAAINAASKGSLFSANYAGASVKLSMAAGASYTYFFRCTTQSTIVTGVGVTNHVGAGVTFNTAGISAIDGCFYNEGINSQWDTPSNATGVQYSIAINSYIDREQALSNFPGSLPGIIQGQSTYYANPSPNGDIPCVGGAGGCRASTAPTGMGSGGTVTMYAGSNDHSGSAVLAFGTSPGGSGIFYIAQVSKLTGDYGAGGACVVSLNDNSTAWASPALAEGFYDHSSFWLRVHWIGTVSASSTYYISYICS